MHNAPPAKTVLSTNPSCNMLVCRTQVQHVPEIPSDTSPLPQHDFVDAISGLSRVQLLASIAFEPQNKAGLQKPGLDLRAWPPIHDHDPIASAIVSQHIRENLSTFASDK